MKYVILKLSILKGLTRSGADCRIVVSRFALSNKQRMNTTSTSTTEVFFFNRKIFVQLDEFIETTVA